MDGSSVVVREFCKVGATVVDERTPGCAFGVGEGGMAAGVFISTVASSEEAVTDFSS